MSTLKPRLGPSDHVVGAEGATVELVEFGDFECPHCGAAHGVLKQVLHRVGSGLLFAFRNFPLSQIHPHAFLAAEAAEAAGAQGEYWPMHDKLFENQEALEPDDLVAYAKILRLDVARFAEDLSRNTHAAKVKGDFSSGVRSGVNGTPTFFVDGVRYDESWDPDTLTAALKAAIRARQAT
jgi:protein-disulfide isomerase